MTRTMYDSINANAIPADAQMVAGYVDGNFAWSTTDWARFPNAVKVKIAVASYVPGAHVYDIESGDFTPAEGAQAIMLARSHGENPSAYMSYNTWNQVRVAFASNGWAEPPYWVADYDNNPVLFSGSVAKQYANSVVTGFNYDVSIVADFWPGVDSMFGPVSQGESMELIRSSTALGGSGEISMYGVEGKRPIGGVEWELLSAAPPNGYGLVYRDLNPQQYNAIPNVPGASPVDFTPVLSAVAQVEASVKAIPAVPTVDFTPVLNAINQVDQDVKSQGFINWLKSKFPALA